MIVKHGVLAYEKETAGVGYTSNTSATFDVYEKTEGNYSEYVIKLTALTDLMHDADGNELSRYDGSPTEYKVIPMPTLQSVANVFGLGYLDVYFSWATPLAEV